MHFLTREKKLEGKTENNYSDLVKICKKLTGLPPYEEKYASEELIQWDRAKAIKFLLKLTMHKSPYVRSFAMKNLGEWRATEAVEPLIKALDDIDHDVRWAAAHSLGRIRDSRAVDPLINKLTHGNSDSCYMRTAVAHSLGQIGDPRAIPYLESVSPNINDTVSIHFAQRAIWEIRQKSIKATANDILKQLMDNAESNTLTDGMVDSLSLLEYGSLMDAIDSLAKSSDDNAVNILGIIAVHRFPDCFAEGDSEEDGRNNITDEIQEKAIKVLCKCGQKGLEKLVALAEKGIQGSALKIVETLSEDNIKEFGSLPRRISHGNLPRNITENELKVIIAIRKCKNPGAKKIALDTLGRLSYHFDSNVRNAARSAL